MVEDIIKSRGQAVEAWGREGVSPEDVRGQIAAE